MSKAVACRRTHARFSLEGPRAGTLHFGFPRPQDTPCAMRLRDISQSGLAFVLKHELPGLEVGDGLAGVRLEVGTRVIQGELLIMHFTPDASPGSVCGALFYPGEDDDILALRACLRELESSF